MKPSAVRAQILREHEEIRGLVDGLEKAVAALKAGAPGAISTARAARDAICARLFDHIDLEDAILAPALAAADAWGPLREQQLLKHHAEQREQLHDLEQLETLDPNELRERLQWLIDDLREDMKHEENALLDPDLLRDDVVGIDVEGG